MEKSCTKCYKCKNINDFHILKTGLHGRHSICKECRSNLRRIYKDEFCDATKYCITCKQILPNNDFYKNKYSNDGLQSYCKICHKKKISESKSKFDTFAKIILNKFKKKHDDLIINITIDDIKNKFEEQEGKCFISNKNLTHVTDIKQRTDNVWNMSIYIDGNCNEINYDNFKLVIHMIYTIKELYKLDFLEVKSMYSSFIN